MLPYGGAIHLLIKPASGNCNMRCRYCFYNDLTDIRSVKSYGMMSLDTIEKIVEKTFLLPVREATIAFQGGEPTLAGLPFFEHFVKCIEKYNIKNIPVHLAIQTNGYVIDDEWAAFFGKNKFLVGLSLDGSKLIHDQYRIDAKQEGTHKRVMHAASLFEKHSVDFNILTVVNALTAKKINEIFNFFMKNNFKYLQFIPCLDPLEEKRGQHEYSLTPELYGDFLKRLFDLWYHEVAAKRFLYIRYFENLVGMLLGMRPESCGMSGMCAAQLVVEADGSVFPCDFYCTDAYKIGNLLEDSFENIEDNRKKTQFIEKSFAVEEKCKNCPYGFLCRGGCRRDRDYFGEIGPNYYCESYMEFFAYAKDRLIEIANKIKNGN